MSKELIVKTIDDIVTQYRFIIDYPRVIESYQTIEGKEHRLTYSKDVPNRKTYSDKKGEYIKIDKGCIKPLRIYKKDYSEAGV